MVLEFRGVDIDLLSIDDARVLVEEAVMIRDMRRDVMVEAIALAFNGDGSG